MICEKIIRRLLPKTKLWERFGGIFLVVIVLAVSAGVPGLILYAAYKYRLWLGLLLETVMCYQLLAVKSLRTESEKVYDELARGDIEGARYAVSMIVGRDTKSLTKEGITKAAVETVAENTSDGVIAPLFYMMIGGAFFGFLYKAVNTMDSMVGYKNESYRYFGTAAAKVDDAANFIPARVAAGLMILAAMTLKFDWKNAVRIFKRDRNNHKSPNAAQTESVMAGALNVQLAGDAWYFGKLYKKPYIGDCKRLAEPADIKRAGRLLYGTAWWAVIIFGMIRLCIACVM